MSIVPILYVDTIFFIVVVPVLVTRTSPIFRVSTRNSPLIVLIFVPLRKQLIRVGTVEYVVYPDQGRVSKHNNFKGVDRSVLSQVDALQDVKGATEFCEDEPV